MRTVLRNPWSIQPMLAHGAVRLDNEEGRSMRVENQPVARIQSTPPVHQSTPVIAPAHAEPTGVRPVPALSDPEPTEPPAPKPATPTERSAFLKPAGWSRKLFGLLGMAWALGGAWRWLSVPLAILGTPLAAAVDVISAPVSIPYSIFGPPEVIGAGQELTALVQEQILNPPPGYDNLTEALRVDPAVAGRGGDIPAMLARLQGDENAPEIMATMLRENMGADISPFMLKVLLSRPEMLQRVLAWSPERVRRAFGIVKDAAPGEKDRGYQLGSSVDLNTFKAINIDVKHTEPVQIGPNLYYGETPGDLPIAKARVNHLWAEVLDRLSNNGHLPESEKFRVTFGDNEFTALPEFLQALRASGHRVRVGMRMQGADLPDLSHKDEAGNYHKVAAPTFSTVNILGDDGQQALFPYVHFELEVLVTPPPPGTPGPRLSGDARWYQGIDSVGFFPGGASSDAKWIGGGKFIEMRGDAAIQVIEDAGFYGDVIRKSATDQNLRADGYGVFGNCGDSISVALQHTLKSHVNSDEVTIDPELKKRILASPTQSFGFFPYLLNDGYILPELEKRAKDPTRTPDERSTARRLIETVKELQDDAVPGAMPNKDAARRALDVVDLVWPDGQEHFGAIGHFKKTVRAYLDRP